MIRIKINPDKMMFIRSSKLIKNRFSPYTLVYFNPFYIFVTIILQSNKKRKKKYIDFQCTLTFQPF